MDLPKTTGGVGNSVRIIRLVVIFASICTIASGRSVRLNDGSDWWSINSEHYRALTLQPSEKQFDTKNFEIIGLSLNTLDFAAVETKLGKAPVVERGDASFGRQQICYVSKVGSENLHLIFEFGEGQESTFYLFRGGANWNGSNLCAKSSKVTAHLVTATGLRLGLSRTDVENILGKPDFVDGDRIVYLRQFNRKATPKEFERSRREYPERLSDERAHQKFGEVLLPMQLEARFKNDQLYYLCVSTDSLNDN